MLAVYLQVALLPTQKGVGQSTGKQTGIARRMAANIMQAGSNGAHENGKPPISLPRNPGSSVRCGALESAK